MDKAVARDIAQGAQLATDRRLRTFVTLDGLRGVAALTVVIWHLPGPRSLPSAYLAVDLFFMLSGFVLAYRYDGKLVDREAAWTFLVMRLIRLYPLYFIGSVLGLLCQWWALGLSAPAGMYGHLAVQGLFAAAALPLLSAHGVVFPLNVPAWSLFYEFLVNAAFGFTYRRVDRRGLIVIVGISAAVLILLLALVGHLQFTGQMPKFLLASIRTIFGFYGGVLLFGLWREERLPVWRIHPAFLLIALILLLGAPAAKPVGPVLTFLVVFVSFPLLLTAGLANEPSGQLARFMSWLGLLSFPLYAVHYPVLTFIERAWPDLAGFPRAAIALAASIAVAWLCLRLWDLPVRAWLSRMRKRRLARATR